MIHKWQPHEVLEIEWGFLASLSCLYDRAWLSHPACVS